MSERMLLFGGTFDPVHHGHLIVARAAAEQGGYGSVTFVPAASPPHKPGPQASGEDRAAMLALAAGDEGLFEVCRLELDRPGPNYTYDTICELRRLKGADVELHWLIGADMLEEFPTWHRALDVLDVARLVVAVRPPWHARLGEIFGKLRGKLPARKLQSLADSIVSTPLIDISATEIRRRIAEGLSVRFLTPDSVIGYIQKHGLYTE